MYFRFLLSLAIQFSQNAWALSPANNPGWITTIYFEGDAASLTDVQVKKLDEIERFIDERCVGPWEAPAWLQIQSFALLTPDPRTDYQLVGARTESVYRYLKKFNVKAPYAGVTMEIVTAEKTSRRDHSVQVAVTCKMRPNDRK